MSQGKQLPTPAQAPDQLELALERTLLACERTLQAWIRTSASLITFGFALFKFFQFLDQGDPDRVRNRVLTTRTFGIVMIVAGILALIPAIWQYQQLSRRLKARSTAAPIPVALIVSILVFVLGILALVEIVFRHV